jgi:hypothetical protein
MNKIKKILACFLDAGSVENFKELKAGLINKTYCIQMQSGKQYILQQVNNRVFKDVPGLMENLQRITFHLNNKIKELNLPLKSFKYYQTLDKKKYYYKHTDSTYWRLSDYIENENIEGRKVNAHLAEETGYLYGQFISLMADIDLKNITKTIPNFHYTHLYYKKLQQAACDDSQERLHDSQLIFKRIKKYYWIIKTYKKLIKNQSIPKRLVHNDTKMTNLLFKKDKAIAVIDLDTCMPGYLMNDFGDSIRSITNTGKEDDQNLKNVNFNFDLFKSYTKGFIKATQTLLTNEEKESLAYSSLLITYEQVLRFYTDYLNGDTYYQISYPKHNLQRTKAQLKLLDEMFMCYEEMKEWVLLT